MIAAWWIVVIVVSELACFWAGFWVGTIRQWNRELNKCS